MEEYDFGKLVGVSKFADHLLGFQRLKQLFQKLIDEDIINKLELLEKSQHHLHFRYISSLTYEIFLELQHNRFPAQQDEPPDFIVVTCTCPVGSGRQSQICKHGLAALVWRLPPSERRKLPAASGTTAPDVIAAITGDQLQTSAPSGAPPSSAWTILPEHKGFLPESIVGSKNIM
jgi:hypothetical protein